MKSIEFEKTVKILLKDQKRKYNIVKNRTEKNKISVQKIIIKIINKNIKNKIYSIEIVEIQAIYNKIYELYTKIKTIKYRGHAEKHKYII